MRPGWRAVLEKSELAYPPHADRIITTLALQRGSRTSTQRANGANGPAHPPAGPGSAKPLAPSARSPSARNSRSWLSGFVDDLFASADGPPVQVPLELGRQIVYGAIARAGVRTARGLRADSWVPGGLGRDVRADLRPGRKADVHLRAARRPGEDSPPARPPLAAAVAGAGQGHQLAAAGADRAGPAFLRYGGGVSRR